VHRPVNDAGTARVLAQAKINLALRVLAREANGYHQIETVFCRLAFGDEVTVRPTDGPRSLTVVGPAVPPEGLGPPETNLAWRAAETYARRAGWPRGFAIGIDKRIPVGAGLGGGSADAGALLRALNAISPQPLEPSALLAVAASIGADVPFLTQASSTLALAWGRGERLLPLPPLAPRACWLFCPEFAVSTSDAYAWLDDRPPRHNAALLAPDGLATWAGAAAMAHNDFETAVGERYPLVAKLLEGLRSPAAEPILGAPRIVELSGTGGTVFAIAAGRDDARTINWRSDEPGVRVLLTETSARVEPVILTE
jgi:4-diphosphocytidyl-2-C-methyl-D-erythritol kinase